MQNDVRVLYCSALLYCVPRAVSRLDYRHSQPLHVAAEAAAACVRHLVSTHSSCCCNTYLHLTNDARMLQIWGPLSCARLGCKCAAMVLSTSAADW